MRAALVVLLALVACVADPAAPLAPTGGYPLTIDDDTSCALFVRGSGIAGDAVGMATVWVLRP